MKITRNESGAIMLEATFCLIACIVVILMVMSFGFIVYQRAMMGIVANQVAEEVAVTYKLRTVTDSSDVSESDVVGVGKYRYFLYSQDFVDANYTKLSILAQTRLTNTSLANDEGGFDVSIERRADDVGRAHYTIVVTNKYSYLFEGIFSTLNIDAANTLNATSYVADTDILSYVNTKNTTDYIISKNPVSDLLDSVIGLVNTVINIFS
jgi:hypothetical protein